MKLKYEKGKFKLVYIAETAEDGFDIAAIVAEAAEDGISLVAGRQAGKIILETDLLRRSRATPKKKTGAHDEEDFEEKTHAPDLNGPPIPVGDKTE